MKYYKVIEVEFDFDCIVLTEDGKEVIADELLTEDDKRAISNHVKNWRWTSPTKKDLPGIITDSIGWHIKSLKCVVWSTKSIKVSNLESVLVV